MLGQNRTGGGRRDAEKRGRSGEEEQYRPMATLEGAAECAPSTSESDSLTAMRRDASASESE